MCLAQGNNAKTLVRLEHVAPLSRVKHSTTGPLGSLFFVYLSYDVESESEITLCIIIDKPLVIYRFSGTCNVMKRCP